MKVVALAGGVGGAKLADGLARILEPDDLVIVVNTGDDFNHFGLHISPDVDTVCYTLAELANPVTGWGRRQESWNALESMTQLGAPDWFKLGDRDLGTHLERTRRLLQGETLTEITQSFCRKWGIKHQVFPMCDQIVATMVKTREEGWLTFQDYFVNKKCIPNVLGFQFKGIEKSQIRSDLAQKILESDLIVICPSNPWVSIDPILNVNGFLDLLKGKKAMAVSPIIGGKTIKGPAAKMFKELGIEPSAKAIAEHYKDLIDLIIIDSSDRDLHSEIAHCGIISHATEIFMKSPKDRIRLAEYILRISVNVRQE